MSAEVSTLPARMGALPVSATRVQAIVPQTLDDAFRLGSMIFASGLAPYSLKTKEAVCAAVMYGMEIGLPPMQAVQSIAVIRNRPGIFGDAAIALVRQSGLLGGFRESIEGEGDDRAGVCEVTRRNPDGTTETLVERFSVRQAKVAGLWEKRGRNDEPTPWQTFPERMLRFRARGFALRDLFADVLKGLVTVEELQDIDTGPRETMPPPTPLRRAPPPPPAIAGPAEPAAPAETSEPTPRRAPPPPPETAAPRDDLADMKVDLEGAETAEAFDDAWAVWMPKVDEMSRGDRERAQAIYEEAGRRFG